jgi:hypothetical protein
MHCLSLIVVSVIDISPTYMTQSFFHCAARITQLSSTFERLFGRDATLHVSPPPSHQTATGRLRAFTGSTKQKGQRMPTQSYSIVMPTDRMYDRDPDGISVVVDLDIDISIAID